MIMCVGDTQIEVMSMNKHKPKHIGIIPDGNRRWTVEQGMSKKDGYEHGLKVSVC